MTEAERSRERRRRKAEAEGRTVREWVRRESEQQGRAARKRKARAKAAAMTRPHDAHVVAWRNQPRTMLHDAHVREFKRCKARVARWRVAHDPAYRLNMRLRVQIRKALKGGKSGRSWEEFVGYTLDDLMRHLQRMLPKAKSLSDCLSDGWHIDHITPKSTYDLSHPTELRSAWCLSNLRLIPPTQNLKKGARREVLI